MIPTECPVCHLPGGFHEPDGTHGALQPGSWCDVPEDHPSRASRVSPEEWRRFRERVSSEPAFREAFSIAQRERRYGTTDQLVRHLLDVLP